MDSRTMRRNFAAGLLAGLRVVWPVGVLFTALLPAIAVKALAAATGDGEAPRS